MRQPGASGSDCPGRPADGKPLGNRAAKCTKYGIMKRHPACRAGCLSFAHALHSQNEALHTPGESLHSSPSFSSGVPSVVLLRRSPPTFSPTFPPAFHPAFHPAQKRPGRLPHNTGTGRVFFILSAGAMPPAFLFYFMPYFRAARFPSVTKREKAAPTTRSIIRNRMLPFCPVGGLSGVSGVPGSVGLLG